MNTQPHTPRNLVAEQAALPPPPAGLDWAFDMDANDWVLTTPDDVVEVEVWPRPVG